MRERFIYDRIQGAIVPITEHRRPEVQRSLLPAPMLSTDVMSPAEHPLDGRTYDSKSSFRAITKAHGYTEMGNDPARLRLRVRPMPDATTISDTVEKAFARVERGETV